MESMEKPKKTKEEKEFPKGVILDKYDNPYGKDNTPANVVAREKFEPIPTVKTEKNIKEEKEENLEAKVKLNLALGKLRKIVDKLPKEDPTRPRAEHTLRSVEDALSNLGKSGVSKYEYPVAVEGCEGSPQEPYTQSEGIPVDELIDILKTHSTKLKEGSLINPEKPRRLSDIDNDLEEAKELDDITDGLIKNSRGYFEAHYTKEHGEGGAWKEEEKNRQDLRTRHEAKLVSKDYRATGNEEDDYKAAMEILKHRRELILVKESEQDKKFARLKALKEEIRELNEKYFLESQREEKAILYSKLEKAKKEYEKLEEELDGISTKDKKDDKKEEKLENKEEDKKDDKLDEKKDEKIEDNEEDKLDEKKKEEESDFPLDELNDLRDDYLKAKRLRGNVFRGKIMGGFFGRKLPSFSFRGLGRDDDMYFGGKKGAQELEKVRKEYEEELSQYRSRELVKLEKELAEKMKKGEITPEGANAEIQARIIGLLKEEQAHIDTRSVQGIEKNTLEKMKTKWRQLWGKRLIASGGLYGASAVLVATGVGGVVAAGTVLGARVAMGGVGTYVGVEAALERYGETLGHVGLINRIKNKKFVTDESLDKHIRELSQEDIKKEAARLKMLQVEKGVSLNNLGTSKDPNGRIALAIIKRDHELTAEEVMKSVNSENPTANFADILSNKLAMEIGCRNEIVESEVDKERKKKMARKILAGMAGGGVGWLIGGSLFSDASASTQAAGSAHAPTPPDHGPLGPIDNAPVPPVEHIVDHAVAHGDKLWNIIDKSPDVHQATAGLSKGAHTFLIDFLKDKFAHMTPAELVERGFNTHGLTDGAEIINRLDVGNVLHLHGIVDNSDLIAEGLKKAQELSPAAATAIERHDALLAAWTAAHPHQTLTNAIIEKIIKGK